ncbi:type VII secretion target [Micromonospora sp. CPCC 205561]|uniref:type VII secretion target n=1 Tax=Micromonospora sp. CPCC 205561 TaxID=3122407 RepID=UPI002FF38622
MTEEPLTVRPEALRRAAGGLDDAAYRLGHGLLGTPGLGVPAPEWPAAAALADLESAVHAWLGGLGSRVAATAWAVRAAAGAYEAADDRAARRLAVVPR